MPADAERERLTAEVAAARERLRALILQTPERLALLEGPEHRFVLVNDADSTTASRPPTRRRSFVTSPVDYAWSRTRVGAQCPLAELAADTAGRTPRTGGVGCGRGRMEDLHPIVPAKYRGGRSGLGG